jgi:hypothetical protein
LRGPFRYSGKPIAQNIRLDQVIAVAIPGNPIMPSDVALTIVYLPQTPSGG